MYFCNYVAIFLTKQGTCNKTCDRSMLILLINLGLVPFLGKYYKDLR